MAIDYQKFAELAIALYRRRRELLSKEDRRGLDAAIGEEIVVKLAMHGSDGPINAIAADMDMMRRQLKLQATERKSDGD